MMRNICIAFLLCFGLANLDAQEFETLSFLEIGYSSQQLSSPQSYSYTFHKFDPALFLNDAHEHFNVNSIEPSTEIYQTVQLRFQYAPNEQLWLSAAMPYSFHRRTSNASFYNSEDTAGFGDLFVEGNYQWYNSLLTQGKEKWEAYLSAGIELATGKYDFFDDAGELEPILLPGSGSTDYVFSNTIILKQNSLQYFMVTKYRMNAKNKFGYKFGDLFYNQLKVHYPFNQYQTIKLGINFDASFHLQQADEMNGRKLINEDERGRDSGGQWLNAGLEFQAQLNQVVLSSKYALPVYQKLDGQQPKIDGFFQLSLKYLL